MGVPRGIPPGSDGTSEGEQVRRDRTAKGWNPVGSELLVNEFDVC